MPGVNPPGDQALRVQLGKLEERIRALETQQQFVVVDPTHESGDPAHGYAVVVLGNLRPITGIAAYGIASYREGEWTQL